MEIFKLPTKLYVSAILEKMKPFSFRSRLFTVHKGGQC